MKKPRIRTMQELSARIGISRPTLSKYFQDEGSVRPSTREKIKLALEAVDYTPNFFATRMNRKSTGLIGLIVPYVNDMFFTSLIQAMDTHALESDYVLITQSAYGDSQLEGRAAENCLSMNVDGVIVAPIGDDSSLATINRLKAQMPVVLVDSRIPDELPDVDFVGTDNEQSISLIVHYLCRSGAPPVFLGMPRINSNSLERESAYAHCARELGFAAEFIATDMVSPTWEFEKFADAVMQAHFGGGRYVDRTILCANDRLAMGVIRAAHRHRLFARNAGPSAGFRVAGHDDHPLSAFMNPGLTTVSRNINAMGKAAVEQVIGHRSAADTAAKGRVHLFDAELRVRESA